MEKHDGGTTNTVVIVGCVAGGCVILGGVAVILVFYFLRRKRKAAAAAAAASGRDAEADLENGVGVPASGAPSAGGAGEVVDTTDEAMPTAIPAGEPGEPLKNLQPSVAGGGSHELSNRNSKEVIHVDHTDVAVPAELKPEEVAGLIRSMKDNHGLPAVTRCSKKTAIARVMTYAADDEITFEAKQNSQESTMDPMRPRAVEELLYRLIRHGPRQYDFAFDELAHLLRTAAVAFENDPSMLEVPVPCTIYGDIHGQYSDLHRWFNLNGWPHQTRSVFLGDFVDRGSHGIEVVAMLCCLKLVFPQKLFMLRGNHEEESLNRAYSFFDEVLCRFPPDPKDPYKDGRKMYSYFKDLFMQLPLAVLVGGRVLAMHGGLSPKMESLQAIRDIRRPIDDFEVGSLECDLVWSDPDTAADSGFRPNLDREPNNGIGQLFAADTVKATCDRLNVDLIIRGHQAPLHGYALFAEGRMMTLFSAPGYKGTSPHDVNMGACIELDASMRVTIKQIQVTPLYRRNRVQDTERVKVKRKQQRAEINALVKKMLN